jgi:hypothetical protein
MSSSFSICRARSRAMCNFAKRKRNRRKPVHFAEPKCAQNAAEDRSRSNQCISDAEPAEPNLKKRMHFRCRAQMCTNCSRSNQCISDAKPKCANFSVCTEKPRSTKMHFNGEIPSARCKCARMPDAIQCSKLKTQSIQMQCQLQSVQQQCKKPIIP